MTAFAVLENLFNSVILRAPEVREMLTYVDGFSRRSRCAACLSATCLAHIIPSHSLRASISLSENRTGAAHTDTKAVEVAKIKETIEKLFMMI